MGINGVNGVLWDYNPLNGIYPLVRTNGLLLKMTICS